MKKHTPTDNSMSEYRRLNFAGKSFVFLKKLLTATRRKITGRMKFEEKRVNAEYRPELNKRIETTDPNAITTSRASAEYLRRLLENIDIS